MIFWISNKWGDKLCEFATETEASEAFKDSDEHGIKLMLDDIVLAVK